MQFYVAIGSHRNIGNHDAKARHAGLKTRGAMVKNGPVYVYPDRTKNNRKSNLILHMCKDLGQFHERINYTVHLAAILLTLDI